MMLGQLSDLLVDDIEVLQYIIHAALLHHFTGVSLCKAVNPHAVLYAHVTQHVVTAGLSNGLDLQQVGRC